MSLRFRYSLPEETPVVAMEQRAIFQILGGTLYHLFKPKALKKSNFSSVLRFAFSHGITCVYGFSC